MRRTVWRLSSSRPLRPQPWHTSRSLLYHPQCLRLQSTLSATTNDDISPTLLSRARAIAAEHESLTSSQSDAFSPGIARRLGALSRTTGALKSYDAARTSLDELQALLSDPSTDGDLRDLALDDLPTAQSTVSSATRDLITSLVPEHPFAHLPCMVEIRPGAGGGEASLFAADLFRMYSGWLSRAGLRSSVLKLEDADGAADSNSAAAGPISEAILEVLDGGSYGLLRCEAGVHRVQRVPATESKGRTHTSSAAVVVLPLFPDDSAGSGDEAEEALIDPKDVRVDFMRARGAGGQHVNTTNSAVRLTHAPTGTVVSIQDQRSQHKNREKAWRILRSKVAQMRREEKEASMLALRRGVVQAGKTGRENKVRTYNWGQQRVTDHRSGFSIHGLGGVIEGGEGLDRVMESVRAWMRDEDVLALAAEEEERQQQRAAQAGGKKQKAGGGT